MRLLYLIGLAVGLAGGPALTTVAQQLDPGFAPTSITISGGGVQAMAKQPDGKVIVSGDFQTMNGQPTSQVARLNANGSPDLAFRAQTGSGPNGLVAAVAVQPDGKIVLGAQYNLTRYNGVAVKNPVRLNADGSLDTAFNPGGAGGAGWQGEIRSVVVQPDGKILVGGSLYAQFNGQPTHGLVRLLPNGDLDTSFNIGTGFNGNSGDRSVLELVVQPDGKIVAAGSFTTVDGYSQAGIARLNANGSLDTSFASPLAPQAIVLGLALQADGKLLVGGAQFGSGTSAQLLRRLLPNGTTDASFQGGPSSGIILDLSVRADGSILVVGSFGDYNGAGRSGLARVSSAGVLDAAFAASPGYATLLKAVELDNGQYLIGGYFSEFDGRSADGLARLTATGRADASYSQSLGYLAGGAISPQANGEVLLNFHFTSFNGQAVASGKTPLFHRVNADGTYNGLVALPSATSRPNGSDYGTNAFAQPDGTFYATYQTNDSTAAVRRVLANGTFDATFAATELRWSRPYPPVALGASLTVHPGGGLLVSGGFARVGGQPRTFVARLNADGTLNTQFAPPANAAWQVPTVGTGNTAGFRYAVGLPNGQTLVVWNDTTRSYVARLNLDGNLDNTFSIGTGGGPNALFSATPVADGKILISGDFTAFNGQAAPNGLLRLLPSGAPNATFAAASAARGFVEQTDGRLVIVAPGTNPQNVNIRRLLTNGSFDASFQPVPVVSGTRAPAAPMLYLQPGTQAIWLSGDFTSVAGQPRQGLARLVNVALATRPAAAAVAPLADVFPNPAHDQLQLRLAAPPTGPVLLADLQGRTVRRWALAQTTGKVPLAGLAPGVYLLGIATAAGQSWQRVVVE